MPDTQWPRYIVFDKSSERSPHNSAGSVHAADPEMAMLNARDVFVRRPQAISLWVVRDAHIFSKTAEELTENPTWADDLPPAEADPEPYQVFQKKGHRGKHIHVGEVEASSPQRAMLAAIEQYPDSGRKEPTVWWVVPDRQVIKSTPEDIAEMFEIAKTKPFRDQGYFLVQTKRRQAKAEIWESEEEEDLEG